MNNQLPNKDLMMLYDSIIIIINKTYSKIRLVVDEHPVSEPELKLTELFLWPFYSNHRIKLRNFNPDIYIPFNPKKISQFNLYGLPREIFDQQKDIQKLSINGFNTVRDYFELKRLSLAFDLEYRIEITFGYDIEKYSDWLIGDKFILDENGTVNHLSEMDGFWGYTYSAPQEKYEHYGILPAYYGKLLRKMLPDISFVLSDLGEMSEKIHQLQKKPVLYILKEDEKKFLQFQTRVIENIHVLIEDKEIFKELKRIKKQNKEKKK